VAAARKRSTPIGHHHLHAIDRREVPEEPYRADRSEKHLLPAAIGLSGGLHLGLTVESLNAFAIVRCRPARYGRRTRILRVLELLREVQAAGAVGMRVEEDKTKGSTGLLFFRRDDVPPTSWRSRRKSAIAQALPDRQQFVLIYSPARGRRTSWPSTPVRCCRSWRRSRPTWTCRRST